MSHELTVRETGQVEFAFTGDRNKIWHGLGNQLSDGASIDTWIAEAGLEWKIRSVPVMFKPEGEDEVITFPERNVLYREDNNVALGMVSDSYQVVQPSDVLEFFRDLTQNHGMKLSAAGSVFGGRRFWAIADVSELQEVMKGDQVGSKLLLTSSADGTLATTAMFTSTRVVCNNTLNVAMNGGSTRVVKFTHRRLWDPTAVKIDLGLLEESWGTFMSNLKALASRPMNSSESLKFFQSLEFDPEKEEAEQTWKVHQRVNSMRSLLNTGAGADIASGTAWGALNAVTNYYTHGPLARNGKNAPSRQFWSSYFGPASEKKETAFKMLLETA